MDDATRDAEAFFDRHKAVYPLYEVFYEKLLAEFPDTRVKVQKSQISYYNRHLYACVSFLKVRKKAEVPDDYFVLTLGLPAPLESTRVALDDPLRHQQPLRPGRGAVRLGCPGVLVRAG